jgi:hypothetical protein
MDQQGRWARVRRCGSGRTDTRQSSRARAPSAHRESSVLAKELLLAQALLQFDVVAGATWALARPVPTTTKAPQQRRQCCRGLFPAFLFARGANHLDVVTAGSGVVVAGYPQSTTLGTASAGLNSANDRRAASPKNL